MEIAEKDVRDSQKVYKLKFGKVIDTQIVRTQLIKLVKEMGTVYQPIK